MLNAVLVFAALSAAVAVLDKLAQKLACDLNAEWKAGAVDWSRAAGADEAVVTQLETVPELEVKAPGLLLTWAFGLSAAALTGLAVWHGAEPVSSALLCALLTTAAFVDLRVQLLPDVLLWPSACLGAALAVYGETITPVTALSGALFGGTLLALLSLGYRLLRGRDGLGQGDIKLVALAGLWIGWQPLPWMLLSASVCAIALILLQPKTHAQTRIAFGPALVLAFFIARTLIG